MVERKNSMPVIPTHVIAQNGSNGGRVYNVNELLRGYSQSPDYDREKVSQIAYGLYKQRTSPDTPSDSDQNWRDAEKLLAIQTTLGGEHNDNCHS